MVRMSFITVSLYFRIWIRVSLQHQKWSKSNTTNMNVFALGSHWCGLGTHDLAGWFIMFRVSDTHFPEFSGVWTALFDPFAALQPLGLGILVGPGRRNDSRGICQEPNRKTVIGWCWCEHLYRLSPLLLFCVCGQIASRWFPCNLPKINTMKKTPL